VRALLVVNPAATSTTPRTREVIVHALASELDLEVVETQHRGHARDLARGARHEGLDAVLTLGGDGTVNEVVNGLLHDGLGDDVPLLGAVPGGSANVFVRALGLPPEPIEATGALLEAIGDKRTRTIGLGTAEFERSDGSDLRSFAVNAGEAIDADIIASMEQQRSHGRTATPGRYLATTISQFFLHTDRRDPALTVSRPGVPSVEGVYFAMVQNTAPWTFFGPIPLDPCPRASFDTGLDLFAARSMGLVASLRHVRRMVLHSGAAGRASLLTLHDQAELVLTANRPTPLQVDGDACGSVTSVRLRSVPLALHTLC
jgi:diacylglycerol kinase family enzyme